jgi:hypothetical protein
VCKTEGRVHYVWSAFSFFCSTLPIKCREKKFEYFVPSEHGPSKADVVESRFLICSDDSIMRIDVPNYLRGVIVKNRSNVSSFQFRPRKVSAAVVEVTDYIPCNYVTTNVIHYYCGQSYFFAKILAILIQITAI